MPSTPREPVLKEVVLSPLRGLEIESNPLTRNPASFTRLDNVVLSQSGSLAKIRQVGTFREEALPSGIVAMLSYRRTVGEPLQVLGIGQDDTLYDLVSGGALAAFPSDLGAMPYMGVIEGQWFDDRINYVVVVPENGRPFKWDDQQGVTSVGVSTPTEPPIFKRLFRLGSAEENAYYVGIQLVGARRYAYTYYNPITRHESNLSPAVAIGPNNPSGLADTDVILSILLELPTTPPTYGDGYTHKRLYATDTAGGEEFFLVSALSGAINEFGDIPIGTQFVADGKVVAVSPTNPDHPTFGISIAITPFNSLPNDALMIIHYAPTGADTAEEVLTYEVANTIPITVDALLVEPAPADGQNGPPPVASNGAVHQGRLWLSSGNKLYFSEIVGTDPKSLTFESFPEGQDFTVDSREEDPLTALQPEYNSLLVARSTGLSRVTGVDPADIALVHLDNQVGVTGKRAITASGGKTFFMSEEGFQTFAVDYPTFIGKLVKSLVDSITDKKGVKLARASQAGLVLAAFETTYFDEEGESLLLLLDTSEESPYTVVRGDILAESTITAVEEVLLEDGTATLVAFENGFIYRLLDATQGLLSAASVLTSQKLPQDQHYLKRLFLDVRVLGEFANIPSNTIAFSVDGRGFGAPTKLRERNQVGHFGNHLEVQVVSGQPDQRFRVDSIKVRYVEYGEPL